MGMATSIAMMLSAAIAGVATSIFGPAGAIFFGAGLIALAFIIISFLKEPETPRSEPETEEQTSGKAGIWAGIKTIKDNPLLLTIIVIITLLNFIVSPLNVLFAPYVLELGADAKIYGFLSASLVLGNFLAMFVLNFVKIKKPLLVLGWGTFGIGLGLLGLALAPAAIISAMSLLLMGTIASVLNIAIRTIFQERVPADILGRTMGLVTALSQSAQPAGYVLAAALLAITSAKISFAAMAFAMAIASLLWLRPAVKKQFNLAANDQAPDRAKPVQQ